MKQLGVFLFLVGGFFLGYITSETFMKPNETPVDHRGSAARSDTEANSDGSESRSSEPAARSDDPEAPPATGPNSVTQDTSSSRDRLLEIVARVESERRSTGVIRGRVFSSTGVPLPGVEISASGARFRRSPPTSSSDVGPSEYISRQVEARIEERVDSESAVSDAEGHFELTGVPNGRTIRLSAERDGYQFDPVHDARSGQYIEFIGDRVIELAIDVIDADGATVDQASIQFEAGNSSRSQQWTAKSPRIPVSPGVYQVSATAGDRRSPPISVTVGAGTQQRIVLELRGRAGLRVKLLPEKTTGYVWCEPVSTYGTDPLRLLESGKPTHARGTIEHLDIPPGQYHVGVSRFQHELEETRIVDVGDGITTIEVHLPEVTPDQLLVVHCSGPDGAPLPHASLSLLRREENRTSSFHPNERRNPDGGSILLVGRYFWEEIASGEVEYVLRASAVGFGSKEVVVTNSPMEIRFSSPALLTVTYPGYLGSRYEGKLSARLLLEERGRWSATAESMDGNDFRFTEIEPGEYDLITSIDGNRVDEQPIVLSPGENRVSVPLPTLYRLVLRLTPADSRRSLQIMGVDQEGDDSRHVEIPPDAADVTVENLAAGRYDLMVEAAGNIEIMSVDVRQDSTVTFDPKPLNAIRIRVFDPNGKFADAGFEDGDVIIAVGSGKPFESMMEVQMQLMSLMGNSDAKVTVQRDGRTVELEFDASFLESPSSFRQYGGKFLPATREE